MANKERFALVVRWIGNDPQEFYILKTFPTFKKAKKFLRNMDTSMLYNADILEEEEAKKAVALTNDFYKENPNINACVRRLQFPIEDENPNLKTGDYIKIDGNIAKVISIKPEIVDAMGPDAVYYDIRCGVLFDKELVGG